MTSCAGPSIASPGLGSVNADVIGDSCMVTSCQSLRTVDHLTPIRGHLPNVLKSITQAALAGVFICWENGSTWCDSMVTGSGVRACRLNAGHKMVLLKAEFCMT